VSRKINPGRGKDDLADDGESLAAIAGRRRHSINPKDKGTESEYENYFHNRV